MTPRCLPSRHFVASSISTSIHANQSFHHRRNYQDPTAVACLTSSRTVNFGKLSSWMEVFFFSFFVLRNWFNEIVHRSRSNLQKPLPRKQAQYHVSFYSLWRLKLLCIRTSTRFQESTNINKAQILPLKYDQIRFLATSKLVPRGDGNSHLIVLDFTVRLFSRFVRLAFHVFAYRISCPGPNRKNIGSTRAWLEEYLKKLPSFGNEPTNEEECTNTIERIEPKQISIGKSLNRLLQS